MSPKPVIEHSAHDYSRDCPCRQCFETEQRRLYAHYAPYGSDDPLAPARGIIFGLVLSLGSIILALVLAGVIWTHVAKARTGDIKPVKAPQSLLKARAECPVDKPLKCRAALVHAYEAVRWQRHARWGAKTSTSKDVVLDAINWASEQTGVPAWRLANIARCESHLFFLAHNGQYLGVWQLGATHRSDPIFDVVPWMDPYAQAIHVARFIKAHGSGAWQCSEYGGLRW